MDTPVYGTPPSGTTVCARPEVCFEKFNEMERRILILEEENKTHQQIWASIADLKAAVANLNGRLAGYIIAAGIAGSVVAIIVEVLIQHISGDQVKLGK